MAKNLPDQASSVQDISITDENNPRSVLNLVTPAMREALAELTHTHEEYFNIDESDLYKLLRANGYTPTPLDHRLRLQFWNEYHRVQAKGDAQMNVSNVVLGLCSRELFYARYLKNPHKIGWILCPPTGYMTKTNEALEFSIDQMREILDLPIQAVGKDGVAYGKIDTKLATLKIKIFEVLHAIVKGAPVQRNLNVNVTHKEMDAAASSDEDLMKQLHELEVRERRARNIPDIQAIGSERVQPENG